MKLYCCNNTPATSSSLQFFIEQWQEAYSLQNVSNAAQLLANTPCASHLAISEIHKWAIQEEQDAVIDSRCSFYIQACGVSDTVPIKLATRVIKRLWLGNTEELDVTPTSGSSWQISLSGQDDEIIIAGARNVAVINSIYKLALMLFGENMQSELPIMPGAVIALDEVACYSSNPNIEMAIDCDPLLESDGMHSSWPIYPKALFTDASHSDWDEFSSNTPSPVSSTPKFDPLPVRPLSSLFEVRDRCSNCSPTSHSSHSSHASTDSKFQQVRRLSIDYWVLWNNSQRYDTPYSWSASPSNSTPWDNNIGTPVAQPEAIHSTGSSITAIQSFNQFNQINNNHDIKLNDLLKMRLYNGRLKILEPNYTSAQLPESQIMANVGPVVAGIFPRVHTAAINKTIQSFVASLLQAVAVDFQVLGLATDCDDGEYRDICEMTSSWEGKRELIDTLLEDCSPLFANTFAEATSLDPSMVYKDEHDNNYFYLISDGRQRLRPSLGAPLFDSEQVARIKAVIDKFARDNRHLNVRDVPEVSPPRHKQPKKNSRTKPLDLFHQIRGSVESPSSPTSCELNALLSRSTPNTP